MASSFASLTPMSMTGQSEASMDNQDDTSVRRSTRKRKLTEKNLSTTPKGRHELISAREPSPLQSSPPPWGPSPAESISPVNGSMHGGKIHVKQEAIAISTEEDSIRRSSRKRRRTEKASSPAPPSTRQSAQRLPSQSIYASPMRESSTFNLGQATATPEASPPVEPDQEPLEPVLQTLWPPKKPTDAESGRILSALQAHDGWPLPGTFDTELGLWYVRQLSDTIARDKTPIYPDAAAQLEFLAHIARFCRDGFESAVSSAVAKANSEMRIEWKIREEEESRRQEKRSRRKANQRLKAHKRRYAEQGKGAKLDGDDDDDNDSNESEASIMKSIVDGIQQKMNAIGQSGRKDVVTPLRKKWLRFVTTFLAEADTLFSELDAFEEPKSLPSPEESHDVPPENRGPD